MLSKEKIINMVIEHKNNIENATNQIRERLSEVQPQGEPLGRDAVEFVQKKIDNVVKELSIIGGFCGKGERNFVYKASNAIGGLTALDYIDSWIASCIRFWCTMVNCIMVDFNKTPLKFVGDFRRNLKNLETQVKGLIDRKMTLNSERARSWCRM